ncbi:MAG TPA: molybdenum cofactor guanylyltransferase [Kofleriaceae bacterium]|nr:molybdenum cofactor guanylyltransferase [Kofleriaceae bacterium]
MKRADVTGLILAGGQATRLGGIDKRLVVVAGRTIFDRQVEALAPCVAEIVVSARRAVHQRGEIAGFRTVADDVADVGPLAGIAAGLVAVTTPWLFVLAGDMPWVSRALIALVLARADDESDAVGIRIGSRPQPLCTALRTEVWRPIVTGRIAAGLLKASALLTDVQARVRWIEEGEVRGVDPELRSLHNVNAASDIPSDIPSD